MANPKGLGKGLGALMGDYVMDEPVSDSPYRLMPIQKIEPNPDQPRQNFDEEELERAIASFNGRSRRYGGVKK